MYYSNLYRNYKPQINENKKIRFVSNQFYDENIESHKTIQLNSNRFIDNLETKKVFSKLKKSRLNQTTRSKNDPNIYKILDSDHLSDNYNNLKLSPRSMRQEKSNIDHTVLQEYSDYIPHYSSSTSNFDNSYISYMNNDRYKLHNIINDSSNLIQNVNINDSNRLERFGYISSKNHLMKILQRRNGDKKLIDQKITDNKSLSHFSRYLKLGRKLNLGLNYDEDRNSFELSKYSIQTTKNPCPIKKFGDYYSPNSQNNSLLIKGINNSHIDLSNSFFRIDQKLDYYIIMLQRTFRYYQFKKKTKAIIIQSNWRGHWLRKKLYLLIYTFYKGKTFIKHILDIHFGIKQRKARELFDFLKIKSQLDKKINSEKRIKLDRGLTDAFGLIHQFFLKHNLKIIIQKLRVKVWITLILKIMKLLINKFQKMKTFNYSKYIFKIWKDHSKKSYKLWQSLEISMKFICNSKYNHKIYRIACVSDIRMIKIYWKKWKNIDNDRFINIFCILVDRIFNRKLLKFYFKLLQSQKYRKKNLCSCIFLINIIKRPIFMKFKIYSYEKYRIMITIQKIFLYYMKKQKFLYYSKWKENCYKYTIKIFRCYLYIAFISRIICILLKKPLNTIKKYGISCVEKDKNSKTIYRIFQKKCNKIKSFNFGYWLKKTLDNVVGEKVNNSPGYLILSTKKNNFSILIKMLRIYKTLIKYFIKWKQMCYQQSIILKIKRNKYILKSIIKRKYFRLLRILENNFYKYYFLSKISQHLKNEPINKIIMLFNKISFKKLNIYFNEIKYFSFSKVQSKIENSFIKCFFSSVLKRKISINLVLLKISFKFWNKIINFLKINNFQKALDQIRIIKLLYKYKNINFIFNKLIQYCLAITKESQDQKLIKISNLILWKLSLYYFRFWRYSHIFKITSLRRIFYLKNHYMKWKSLLKTLKISIFCNNIELYLNKLKKDIFLYSKYTIYLNDTLSYMEKYNVISLLIMRLKVKNMVFVYFSLKNLIKLKHNFKICSLSITFNSNQHIFNNKIFNIINKIICINKRRLNNLFHVWKNLKINNEIICLSEIKKQYLQPNIYNKLVDVKNNSSFIPAVKYSNNYKIKVVRKKKKFLDTSHSFSNTSIKIPLPEVIKADFTTEFSHVEFIKNEMPIDSNKSTDKIILKKAVRKHKKIIRFKSNIKYQIYIKFYQMLRNRNPLLYCLNKWFAICFQINNYKRNLNLSKSFSLDLESCDFSFSYTNQINTSGMNNNIDIFLSPEN